MSVGFRRQLAHLWCERAERQTGVARLALHQLPLELVRSFGVPALHERNPSAVQRLRGHGGRHRGRLATRRPLPAEQLLHLCVAWRIYHGAAVVQHPAFQYFLVREQSPRSAPAAYAISVPTFR
ncbi:hypothetical protein DVH05_027932 [Phytophthora capsici]|nr:hypothetical protein DVH05_027932 [Phytophthora capsici]